MEKKRVVSIPSESSKDFLNQSTLSSFYHIEKKQKKMLNKVNWKQRGWRSRSYFEPFTFSLGARPRFISARPVVFRATFVTPGAAESPRSMPVPQLPDFSIAMPSRSTSDLSGGGS